MSVVVVFQSVGRARAGEPISEGLAAALIPVVSRHGATWAGFSGDVRAWGERLLASIRALGTGTIVVDPPIEHYISYYEDFANSALRPSFAWRSEDCAPERPLCAKNCQSFPDAFPSAMHGRH